MSLLTFIISTLRRLSEKSQKAFLIFYNDQEAEKKLADQLGVDYHIEQRVLDAKRVVESTGNVAVKVLTIPPVISFPVDFLKMLLSD